MVQFGSCGKEIKMEQELNIKNKIELFQNIWNQAKELSKKEKLLLEIRVMPRLLDKTFRQEYVFGDDNYLFGFSKILPEETCPDFAWDDFEKQTLFKPIFDVEINHSNNQIKDIILCAHVVFGGIKYYNFNKENLKTALKILGEKNEVVNKFVL